MSGYFVPTEHDADPQGIILSRFFTFIHGVAEQAIRRADPQEGAEHNVRAFLRAHREELDITFGALLSMFRHLAIPLEPSHGNSSDSNSAPDVTHVNGVLGSLRNPTTTTQTSEDGSDDIPHHGNGAVQASTPSWTTAVRIREAARRAAAQMQTTTMTAPLHQNGVQDATSVNGNGTHPTTTALPHHNGVQNATHLNGNGIHPTMAEESDESSEDDGSLLPQTTYTPTAVYQRRDAQNMTGVSGYSIRHATEQSSDDASDGNSDSVAPTPGLASTQHVLQLPMVINGGSTARFQTASGRNLPRFGNMSLAAIMMVE